MKAVLLRHPKTKGEWACPAEAVDAWIAKGWERASESAVLAATQDNESPKSPFVAKAATTGKDK